MAYVNTAVMKLCAEFRGFLLKTGTQVNGDGRPQAVWLMKAADTPELMFDSAWDVLEGLDWLKENRKEACRLLRKNRAAAVVQDSSAVVTEHY